MHVIKRIESVLASDKLPGSEAQRLLAPEGRSVAHPSSNTLQLKWAAVLILLYPRGSADRELSRNGVDGEGDIHIPFILRPQNDTYHAGQIALPGGRHEGQESFPVETALRESREELGIDTHKVRIIGNLSDLYVHVSNTLVSPVVAFSPSPPLFSPDPVEVSAYFSAPFSLFLEKPHIGAFPDSTGYLRAPYFSTPRGRLWGATAMILSELMCIYKSTLQRG